jgi:hypothetical protein
MRVSSKGLMSMLDASMREGGIGEKANRSVSPTASEAVLKNVARRK